MVGCRLSWLALLQGLCALVHTTSLETRIAEIFEDLVTEDGIDLEFPEEWEYRLGIFTVSCFAREGFKLEDMENVCNGVGIDGIYTDEELLSMNGAVLENGIEKEEVTVRVKREAASVPTSYDVRDDVTVNPPSHQGVCGNCYIHAFVAGLEIAYTRLTGQVKRFSQQELTDCFYRGCDGGDYRSVSNMVAITDHLSDEGKYGPYLSQHIKRGFACKAPVTPDALTQVKVVGFHTVTPDTLDYYVYTHGSVMTCMAWKSSSYHNCGDLSRGVGTGVFVGDTVKEGCDHAVLIVGYTPDHYIVKNSHGVTWGDHGYFRIQRGTNACGIEDDMAVIVVEERTSDSSKLLSPNNCPLSKPHYCATSQSCTGSSNCVVPRANKDQNVVRLKTRSWSSVNMQDNRYNRNNAFRTTLLKRDINNERCEDMLSTGCATRKPLCSRSHTIRTRYCQKTCGTCSVDGGVAKNTLERLLGGSTGACKDSSSQCGQFSQMICMASSTIRRACPVKCDACSILAKTAVLWRPEQPAGQCNVPEIANGRVHTGGRTMINHGDSLKVVCDSGHVLSGDPVTCVIQDVFAPDSRLLPECVKVDSEQLIGHGESYRGTKATSVSGRPCLSWNKEVVQGNILAAISPVLANRFLLGNHNMCRNNGLEDVPYCIVVTENEITGFEFCFESPGCDLCNTNGSDAEDIDSEVDCREYADDGECKFSLGRQRNIPMDRWEYCRATCCMYSGC